MVIALLLVMLAPAIAQAQDKSSKPKRGDVVIAKGCLRGSSFENASVTKLEAEDLPGELFTYRLTGDKKVMETIRKKHNGHADVLTAELETDLPVARPGGKTVGNTRITIGVGPGRGMGGEPPPPIPVLRVSAIEHTGVTCR